MELNDTQKKRLKGIAHTLKPVVMIGQHGLKDSVLTELDIALEHHQLIKVKIAVGDREARNALLATIMEHASEATLLQQIGNIAVLYQRNPKRPSLLAITPA